MAIVLLPVILFALLQLGFVQTFLAHKAASYLSGKLETKISIQRLRANLKLDINLKNVVIHDQHDSILLEAKEIQANILKISRKNRVIMFRKIEIDQCYFALRKYEDDSETNLKFLTDYFKSDDTLKVKKKWRLGCAAIYLSDSRFILDDRPKHMIKAKDIGIDFTNLDVDSINMKVADFLLLEDTVFANIRTISLVERSGFKIHNLATHLKLSSGGVHATNTRLETPKSNLTMDLKLLFSHFTAFNDFVNEVDIRSVIKPSYINLEDIAFFAPSLIGMDNMLKISGQVKGEIANLNAKNLILQYGKATSFFGNIAITGLPDIKESFIHFRVKELKTNRYDVENFKLPSSGIPGLKIPPRMYLLGEVNIEGSFSGFYNDFVSYATFKTAIGTFSTDLLMRETDDGDNIAYNGNLFAEEFQLGKFAGLEDHFGKCDLDASISGSGSELDLLNVEFVGVVDSLEFNGNTYNEIFLNGKFVENIFTGIVKIDDEYGQLDLSGSVNFNPIIPEFDIITSVRNAQLYNLQLSERDSLSLFSTKIRFDFKGENLDSFTGVLIFDSTVYYENGRTYFIDNLELTSNIFTNGSREISLESDFIDAHINGNLSPATIYHSVAEMLNYHLSFVKIDDNYHNKTPDQLFDFAINLKDTKLISDLFIPFLHIDPESKIEGDFDSKLNRISINGFSSGIDLLGMKIKDWYLDIETNKDNISIITGADHFVFIEPKRQNQMRLGIDELVFVTNIHNDILNFDIGWDDGQELSSNEAYIEGMVDAQQYPLIETKIFDNMIVINDSIWIFNQDHLVTIDTSSIGFRNLEIRGGNQSIMMDGKISEDPEDIVDVNFDNFFLSNFSFFFIDKGFDLKGAISGDFSMFGLHQDPNFISDLTVLDLYFNDVLMGDADIETKWNDQLKRWNAFVEIIQTGDSGTIKMLELTGDYDVEAETDNFNFMISLEDYNLSSIQPFMKTFMKQFDGYGSGKLAIKGDKSSPYFEGDISVRNTELRIGYINTRYSISDVILFRDGYIGFNDITVYDSLGNNAVLNGKVFHQFFKNIVLDLTVEPVNFASMNTSFSQNELFYGDVFSTGTVTIKGPAKNLVLSVNAVTEDNTYVAIPISYTTSLSDNSFIQFINSTDSVKIENKLRLIDTGISMNFGLDVTEDATIQIYLPMQMGDIKVNGNGLINMGIGSNMEFDINGTYTVNSGTFHFSLQNMLARVFRLRQGGTISWTGDVYEAKVDLKGVYQVRPSLNSLPVLLADSSIYNRRVPVDCVVGLTGDLLNPKIRFSIEMPDATEEIRSLVFNSIDTTNEVAMNQQMISLLVLNSFSINAASGGSASSGINSYEILSNQLSNMLSNISDDFDIGLNYTKGDALTSEQLEVALSTQLFDNRVLVYGSFGVGGYTESDATSNIVGDVLVEVKMTKDGRFRVRAFNKTNTQDLRNDNAPYTQGVGLSYQKEFDKFRDIFKRTREKKKKRKGSDVVLE